MRAAFIIAAAAGFAALPILSGSAQAQATRTFVSGHGEDTNPCSLTAPCRSFAQALTQTAAGGEIVALDSAGYGIVTISHAVSITAPDGIEAAITTTSAADAITINAGASDVVNLRGLILTGGRVGLNGVTFTRGGALNIQNCVIRGFVFDGLNLQPAASSRFSVSDTIVSNNGDIGIVVLPTGSNATNTAFFERVQVIGNDTGFFVNGTGATGGTLQVMAAESAAAENTSIGFIGASQNFLVPTTFTIANSKAIGNATGVSSQGANVTVFLAQTTISGNGFGFTENGPIQTFHNNNITDSNSGSMTTIGQQ